MHHVLLVCLLSACYLTSDLSCPSSTQPPDALMLANIEARMRQLSKLAQGAALKLLTVRRELEEVGVVKRDEHPHIVPFSLGEQNVPQWKFSQTKVHACMHVYLHVHRMYSLTYHMYAH